jgi:hypothetical protein
MNRVIAARHHANHLLQPALLGLLLLAGLILSDTADAGWHPTGATRFSDQCRDIAEIRVRSGWWIDAVQVVCRDGVHVRRGGYGGGEHVFRLRPGEYVIGISGRHGGPGGNYVYALQFHTNYRSSPLYGAAGPDRGWTPFRTFAPRGERITGFVGESGRYLHHLVIATAPTPKGRHHGHYRYAPSFHAGRPVKRQVHVRKPKPRKYRRAHH